MEGNGKSLTCICIALLAVFNGCRSGQSTAPATGNETPTQRINVVIVTIDTLRADHVHSYGYDKISTPVMDGLASQGVLFKNAVAQVPLTTPSHASIFTGTYPYSHGVRDVGIFSLKASSTTLATLLKRRGWSTGAFVGSSVLKKVYGFNQGFDTYDDQMPQSNKASVDVEDVARPASEVVDHAVQWLSGQHGKPFLVWLHFYDPHQPYHPPAAFRTMYPGRPYDAEIAFTDQQLGRFLEAVKNESLDQKTLVVVLADHGEGLGDHGEQRHGIFLYDSTLRIPWIISGPGVPAGVQVVQQARTIDVLPTVLDLLHVPKPPDVQGVSMVPALTGNTVTTTYSYEETLYPKIQMGWSELRGLRTLDWKYIRAPKPELYELRADPTEQTNVIDSHPDLVRQLDEQLKVLLKQSGGNSEVAVTNPVDDKNIAKLKSLGYLAGAPEHTVALNGQGADPKDRVNVLKILDDCMGSDSSQLPPSQRISMLQKALQEDPANRSIYYGLGDQYERAGKYDQAKRVYLDALRKGIRSDSMLSRLGDFALRDGNHAEAINFYEQAAKLNPYNYRGQSNLGMAYLNTGQDANAERIFRWVLTLEEFAPAYNGLGLIDARRRQFDSARTNFQRAIKLDPALAEPELNLALAYKATGDTTNARHSFEEFLRKAPPRKYRHIISQVKDELAAMK